MTSPYTASKVFKGHSSNSFLCTNCVSLLRLKTVISKGKKRRWAGPRTPQRLSKNTSGPSPKKLDLKDTPVCVQKAASKALTSSTGTSQSLEPNVKESLVNEGLARILSITNLSDKSPEVEDTQVKSSLASFKKSAIKYIENSQYMDAFKCLWAESTSAKSALISGVVQGIEKEFKTVTDKNAPPQSQISALQMPLTLDNLEQFNWNDITEELQDKMPVTYHLLDNILPCAEVFKKGRTVGRRGARRLKFFWLVQNFLIVLDLRISPLYNFKDFNYKWQHFLA